MTWVGLAELEAEARRVVTPVIGDYIAGGADDETTRQNNERAFARIGLLPRVLTADGFSQAGASRGGISYCSCGARG